MSVWRNLHFRPPILKKCGGLRISDLVWIRTIKELDGSNTRATGYIVLREEDDSFYHFVADERPEVSLLDELIEWTEVTL